MYLGIIFACQEYAYFTRTPYNADLHNILDIRSKQSGIDLLHPADANKEVADENKVNKNTTEMDGVELKQDK